MARRVGMGQAMVSRAWRAFGLQPHRSETFELSRNPALAGKARDVAAPCLDPPGRALAPCLDEKLKIQAIEGTTPVLPMRPGQIERHSYGYERHGAADLFAAPDAKAGTVIGTCKGRHRSTEFRAFLNQVKVAVPAALDARLVLGDASTHKTRLVHDWLLKRPRWHTQFTPTSASWIDRVECWLSLPTRRCSQRGAFRTTASLQAATSSYIDQTNAAPKPFVRTKTAGDSFASIAGSYQRTFNSHQ